MKNFKIRIGALSLAVALGTLVSCEQENDELLINNDVSKTKESIEDLARFGTDCTSTQSSNWQIRTGTDENSGISNAVDDRSCTYDYTNSGSYGVYRLNSADNSVSGSLQTRIERTSGTVDYSNGARLRVSGTVRILEAASFNDARATYSPDDMRDENGTYIAQVKGKHIGRGGSSDPAIMLLIAKPARWNRGSVTGGGPLKKTNGKQREFHIYAEMIKVRGGSGRFERELIYITTVQYNRDFWVGLTSRFGSNNKHYIDYNVGGNTGTLTVPSKNEYGETVTPDNTKIRMGAYRCKGGKAHIRWKDNLSTTHKYTRR